MKALNDPGVYRQAVLAIQQQIQDKDLDGARTLLNKALKDFPANGGIENLLGIVEIQQGHAELATRAFSVAIKDSPQEIGPYLNLGRIYMQTAATSLSQRQKAFLLYRKVLQMDPNNAEATYETATLLMWARNYQRSMEYLEKMSPEARSHAGVESIICADEAGLGRKELLDRTAASLIANPDLAEQDAMTVLPAMLDTHRADLAELIFMAVDARQTLSAAGLRLLGLAQESEGKLGQARATLERAFAADSSSVMPLVDLARIAEAADDRQGALGYLAHARDMQPKNAALAYEFGVVCLRMKLLVEARKAMGEAVKLAPDNPKYNLGMGSVSSFAQDPTEALPYLYKFHALRPTDASGLLALGTAYFRAKEIGTASKWLKLAANNAATAADAYYYLGRVARQEGHLNEAVAQLTKSVGLNPNQPDVLAELGQVYLQMKLYVDAKKQLDRAVALDANNYSANFGLLQLYARIGDSRREDQSKRFDEIKQEYQDDLRETMRVIEARP